MQATEYLDELATLVFPSLSEEDKEELSRKYPGSVWTRGGPKEKKWEPMAFVIFTDGPCDPFHNEDHSDCEEECKHDEGAYAE